MITKFKSVTSNDLDPSLCYKLSHLLGRLPWSVTHFMDGPLSWSHVGIIIMLANKAVVLYVGRLFTSFWVG